MPFKGQDLTKKALQPQTCNRWWYPYSDQCPKPIFTFLIPEYMVWECPTCKTDYWLDKHQRRYLYSDGFCHKWKKC